MQTKAILYIWDYKQLLSKILRFSLKDLWASCFLSHSIANLLLVFFYQLEYWNKYLYETNRLEQEKEWNEQFEIRTSVK